LRFGVIDKKVGRFKFGFRNAECGIKKDNDDGEILKRLRIADCACLPVGRDCGMRIEIEGAVFSLHD
jgi:hypothetical protein